MKNKYGLFLAYASMTVFVAGVLSVNAAEVEYPVSALGNCGSREECKAFCDNTDNRDLCRQWAEDNGLAPRRSEMRGEPRGENGGPGGNSGQGEGGGDESGGTLSPEEQRLAEEAQANAPGGCKGPEECDAYCSQLENMNECLDYSVKYGYMPAEEAEKIRAEAERGGPGGCKKEEDCRAYCMDPKNAKECMDFTVKEGKITQEEADFMVEQMEKGGGKPGGPTGEGPAEPKIEKEKVEQVLKATAGPGGCKNMQECSAYCRGGEHMDECLLFAEKNGIMAPAELEKAKKLGKLGGPGGCKNEAECDAFCSKEENRDTCFNFAKDNGLMSQEQIQGMQKQMEIMKKLDAQKGPRDQKQSQMPGDNSKMMRDGGPNGGPQGQDQYRSYFDGPSSGQNEGSPSGWNGQMPPEGFGPKDGMQGPPPGFEGMISPYGDRQGPPQGFENMRPPEGFVPPSGGNMQGPPPGYEGMMPPGDFRPPDGGMMPPPPSSDFAPPPPSQDSAPVPSEPSVPPTSMLRFNPMNLIANVFEGLIKGFSGK